MILTNDMFNHIFNDLDYDTKLTVITGYTSGVFVKHFVETFPTINFRLFIGMSQNGITRTEHNMYINIVKKFPHAEIFYQYTDKPTHMKLIVKKKRRSVASYIGSANFSFNGFFEQRELMIPIEDDVSDIVKKQQEISISVEDPKAESLVVGSSTELNGVLQEDLGFDKEKMQIFRRYVSSAGLYVRRNVEYFDSFKLELERFSVVNGETKLIFPNHFKSHKFFPEKKKIVLYWKNSIFECIMTGRFNRELVFFGNEIMELIRGMNNDNIGNREPKYLVFNRINETEYEVY